MQQAQVAVWVTRLRQGRLEVLVEATSGRVPSTVLEAGEHPCEAAWRTVTAATGLDAFRTFRKLPQAARLAQADAAAWHLFQVAPEEELADCAALAWKLLAAVAAADGEAFAPALAVLVTE